MDEEDEVTIVTTVRCLFCGKNSDDDGTWLDATNVTRHRQDCKKRLAWLTANWTESLKYLITPELMGVYYVILSQRRSGRESG